MQVGISDRLSWKQFSLKIGYTEPNWSHKSKFIFPTVQFQLPMKCLTSNLSMFCDKLFDLFLITNEVWIKHWEDYPEIFQSFF